MKINVRNSSLLKMYELCKKRKEGTLHREELEILLEHDDYKLEFTRYNDPRLPPSHISKEAFIDYFFNFENLQAEEINNSRLKIHHPVYKDFFDNLDSFQEKIEKILSIDEDILSKGVRFAVNGLPSSINFEEFDVVFTLSIGNSFGWPYENCIHFDVLNFFNIFDLDTPDSFYAFIGHELHHVGFAKFLKTINSDKLTLEEEFYNFFAFEGLAVKYCNNSDTILSKKIYSDIPGNIGMIKSTWDYFKNDFEDMYLQFKKHLALIRSGNVQSLEYGDEIFSYWFNGHMKDQNKNEVPKLMHTPNYYLGAEIWGLLHDVYGTERVFEILKNPNEFRESYNNALDKIGRMDLAI